MRQALALGAIFLVAIPGQGQALPTPQNQSGQNQAAENAITLVPPERPFRLGPRIGVFAEAQITLQQALQMALSGNKDIQSSRIDREEAEYTLLAARGVWDPLVGANSSFQKQINPVASSLGVGLWPMPPEQAAPP